MITLHGGPVQDENIASLEGGGKEYASIDTEDVEWPPDQDQQPGGGDGGGGGHPAPEDVDIPGPVTRSRAKRKKP